MNEDRVFLSRPCFSLSVHPEASADLTLAAFQTNAIWDSSRYPSLHVAFMDGTEHQKQWVEHIINTYMQPFMTDIKFIWNVPLKDAHIRISFRKKGQAYSYIGTQALSIPRHRETMNLGWIDDDEDYDNIAFKNTGIVVLHEFGHAIGMIHEHQNPMNNPIVWNKPKVYNDAKKLIGWGKQAVDTNIFMLYGSQELCKKATTRTARNRFCSGTMTNGSSYDPTSMMHYFYPQSWMISGGQGIQKNTTMSELDKDWIRRMYSTKNQIISLEKFQTEEVEQIFHIIIMFCIFIYILIFIFKLYYLTTA